MCHYKLLAEYRDVLFRMVRREELALSRDHVERFLAALVTATQEVEVRYLWRPNLPDEADNFVSLRELQPWLHGLRRATEDEGAQALIISHNPEVIDYLAAEDAWLFERDDGGPSRTRPLPLETDSGLKASEQIARGWLRGA